MIITLQTFWVFASYPELQGKIHKIRLELPGFYTTVVIVVQRCIKSPDRHASLGVIPFNFLFSFDA